MTKKWWLAWLVALGCAGVLAVAVAAEPNPSGTVNIEQQDSGNRCGREPGATAR